MKFSSGRHAGSARRLNAARLRGRLNAFREIHEYWEFTDGLTEDGFDRWLHDEIKRLRKLVRGAR